MANKSYALELKAINLYKFSEATSSGMKSTPNLKTSINILPQVLEVDIFQSLFSTVMRAEISVVDTIAMFTNFPISGEEIVVIKYKNVADDIEKELVMIVDTITDIAPDDTLKSNAYIINCVAIEAYANALGNIRQAFEGTAPVITKDILNEHIFDRLLKIFPSYSRPSTYFEDNETQASTIVVPNLTPFKAISMISQLMVSEVSEKYNFMFYQTTKGFHLDSLQNLTQRPNAKRTAEKEKYKFFSNEVSEAQALLQNEERIVSRLVNNHRFGSMSKLSLGYFNNKLFEINIAQKSIWVEPSKIDDVKAISNNKLNTEKYIESAATFLEDEDSSNRVKYKITTQAEGDKFFPVSRMRSRWGRDIISKTSMSQIDYTITIPGTNRFEAGDLFFLEFPEASSFTDNKIDDLVSGHFIITEVKHILTVGGFHSTVMRINKDSYNTSIDRDSRFGE